jgi:hypothetical protein
VKRTAVLLIIAVVLFIFSTGCYVPTSPSPTPSLPPPSITTTEEPIEIVSTTGPLEPINPGGPIVAITLKNVSDESIIFLEAFLDSNGIAGRLFEFTFDVSLSKPLLPGQSISDKETLIGGGFADNIFYPLMINGTLQSNVAFSYTKSVVITSPPE